MVIDLAIFGLKIQIFIYHNSSILISHFKVENFCRYVNTYYMCVFHCNKYMKL